MNFVYKNIQFQKSEKEDWVVVKGEIHNASGANYHAVAFRMVVFIKGMQIINAIITINDFGAGKTRSFEKQIEALDSKSLDKIVRYEIHPQGAY